MTVRLSDGNGVDSVLLLVSGDKLTRAGETVHCPSTHGHGKRDHERAYARRPLQDRGDEVMPCCESNAHAVGIIIPIFHFTFHFPTGIMRVSS